MGRLLPVRGPVSSPYLGGYRSQGGHSGTDFAADMGAPIVAAAAGQVTFAGWSGPYGYLTKVRHSDGTETWYAHQSQMVAQPGQKVSAGQVIGKVGSTGNSSGPHLHFEVRQNGQMVDPMAWLKGAQVPGVDAGPVSRTMTGYRVTPVLPEEYINGAYADIAALESRFDKVATESRFGMVAEESREGLMGEREELPPIPEAEVEWDSIEVSGGNPGYSGQVAEGGVSVQEAYELMLRVGATPQEARMLASFVPGESSGRPGVVNSIGATGLWQVLYPVHKDRLKKWNFTQEDLKDPYKNAVVAYDIYKDQGYSAWEVYTKGSFNPNW